MFGSGRGRIYAGKTCVRSRGCGRIGTCLHVSPRDSVPAALQQCTIASSASGNEKLFSKLIIVETETSSPRPSTPRGGKRDRCGRNLGRLTRARSKVCGLTCAFPHTRVSRIPDKPLCTRADRVSIFVACAKTREKWFNGQAWRLLRRLSRRRRSFMTPRVFAGPRLKREFPGQTRLFLHRGKMFGGTSLLPQRLQRF